MESIDNIRIRHKTDTTSNWNSKNPVLLLGEFGLEITTNNKILIKIGDGKSTWKQLKYFLDEYSYNKLADKPIINGQLQDITVAKSNTSYTEPQVRNIILSNKTPTQTEGNNGDVWITYKR